MKPDGAAILERLSHPDARVRRIAAMDLRSIELDERALGLIAGRLPVESDETVLVALVRALGARTFSPALPALHTLRQSPATTARVAHAAILACDAFEIAGRGVAGS